MEIKRIREWLGLVILTGAAQVAVQLIGFVSGILVIRLLPVHEYAFYTLANTMLGAMTILADGGVAIGVMSEGGKVWQDKQKLGAVVATGMALRRKFAIFALLVAVPALLFLLQKHNASWLMSVLIVLSLIPAFLLALSGTLLEIPVKLHQDLRPMQQYQLEANMGRLALLGVTVFVFPIAAAAIVCSGVSQLWNNRRLRRLASEHIDFSSAPTQEVRRAILSVVQRTMPGAIYYTASSQLPVWLISIFGSGAGIAQIGALGRLAAVLSLITTLFGLIVVPRFSRLTMSGRKVLSRYLQAQFIYIPLCVAILLPVYFFPNWILWILGGAYMGLREELLLMLAGSMVSIMAASAYAMNASRGYVVPPLRYYMALFLVQVLLAASFRLDTVSGVLIISLCTNLFAYVVMFVYGVYRIGESRNEVA